MKLKKVKDDTKNLIGIAAIVAGIGGTLLAISAVMNPDDKREIKEALRKKAKEAVIGKINP